MKKNIALVFCISFLCFSCSNNIDIENVKKQTSNNEIQTKSTIDNGMIDELLDIPVNITLQTPSKKYYLGFPDGQGQEALIYEKDYLTGSQQWIISKHNSDPQTYLVSLVKDPTQFLDQGPGPWGLRLTWADYVNPSRVDAIPYRYTLVKTCRIQFCNDINDSKKYYITNGDFDPLYYKTYEEFLAGIDKLYAPETTNNGVLRFGNNNGTLESNKKWEIIPVDTFTIENIDYYKYPGDNIAEMPDFMTTASIKNQTSIEQSMTIQFSEKATEQSKYSETNGQSLTFKTGLTVGIPNVSSANMEVTTASNSLFLFEGGEAREDSRSYTFPVRVAPYKTVYATAIVKQFRASLSYTATFKGIKTNKIIILSGKWNGIKASEIHYELREEPAGKIIKSFIGTPKGIIDLTK